MKNENQLNGLWGWIKKHVHSIAAVATALGLGAIAATLETIVAADGGPGEGEDGWKTYEPSGTEKIILDDWADNKFKPFYQTLLNDVKTVFNSQSFENQISVVNAVLRKMTVVENYYSTTNPESISQNGINIRLELIELIFAPIKDLIANSLYNSSSQLQFTNYEITYVNSTEFGTLNIPSMNVSYYGDKYEIIGSSYSSPVSSNINLNSNTSVITPNPVNYQPTVIHANNSNNTQNQSVDDSNSVSTIKKIGFVFVSILLLKWAFSDDSKKVEEKT